MSPPTQRRRAPRGAPPSRGRRPSSRPSATRRAFASSPACARAGPSRSSSSPAGAGVTRQAVTKHLHVLAEAGLVRDSREGRERRFELDPSRLEEARRALDVISRQWDHTLGRLKEFLERRPASGRVVPRTPAAARRRPRTPAPARCPRARAAPSSKSRPMSVIPWGTRRLGSNLGSGCAGSGAQSLRAWPTSTKPARRVSEGWPVWFEIVSISSRSEGTSSRSTLAKTRAISSRDQAAQAIGLHEVDRGKEARLAEDVGPGVRHLHLELVHAAGQGQLLERGRRFREQDRVERAVRPVGERDLDRHQAEPACRLQRGAVHVGGGGLGHPLREVADLEPGDAGGGVEVEPAGHAGHVAGIGAARSRAARTACPRRSGPWGRACPATSTGSSRPCAERARRSGAGRPRRRAWRAR